ncbi:hypothetical protein AKJ62_04355 [candidate division MSBL1 archaeon SCGC-AAA259D14]|uniref:Vitamin B12-dependent ribonucleotide reductase n=3 Tax=candidate division MSBL1 TaxID=215777 RepID=A0A133USD9_9EURY|nr:hypothetical protein AKJ62_04355 [candidate division MSBL1 archaeon SCGC-AAA259D14]KXA92940.1 hypothetical protein AKJ66_03135 [candidate division MSBL1 archaeon SCGC-AAA259E22]KXA97113.1 hypothetical protein AKJ38_01905 [candidate division MSBL1 archaeon SCGC-AAA259I14]
MSGNSKHKGSISEIEKRDGRIVDFDQQKITDAIHKALVAVSVGNGKRAEEISNRVVEILEKRFEDNIPSVEDIQDIVIEVLEEEGLEKVAEGYSEYRVKKIEIRDLKEELGIEDEPKLTVNAWEVLKKRYLLRNEKGEIIESPSELFQRVADAVSKVDEDYGMDPDESFREFFEVMSKLEFLPNSPTLFNANAPLGQLSACFVLPVRDSLESIFTAVKNTALIEQTGGGVGFDFSEIRPEGDVVKSTMGVASGPVSFMRVFDTVTDVIKAGGKRRGAMMGVLRADHPDIEKFIEAKSSEEDFLNNFNISVSVTDDFMEAVEKDEKHELINPRTDSVVEEVDARDVWEKITKNAWRTGDPGVIFLDEINRHNPTPEVGEINATNPCGEVPLLPNEACNLGSINVSKMVKKVDGEVEIDWEKLERTVKIAVHFLDNVIDANEYNIPEIEKMVKGNRKVGLGVMGWAELLIRLGIPYDSEKAVSLADEMMEFISKKAREKSVELGRERGSFPNFEKSVWSENYEAMRNATVTSIAPTGSISIIAGCSSSIEPLFSIAFMRNVLEGDKLFEVNPWFERLAKDKGFYSAELMKKIARTGSIQEMEEIPEDVRRIFVTSLDIDPEWHVKMQAVFQKHVDNAVSKTINLPKDASVEDVGDLYKLAWELNCKGITIYRYGSKKEQVLTIGEGEGELEFTSAESEYSGGAMSGICPVCG